MKHASSQFESVSAMQATAQEVLAHQKQQLEQKSPERSAFSFLGSIAIHAVLIWLILWKLPGGGAGASSSESGENYRTIGVVELESETEQTTQQTPTETTDSQVQTSTTPKTTSPEPIPLPGRAPVETTDNAMTEEVIIPGVSATGADFQSEPSGIRNTTTSGTSLIPTKDGVGFFGLGDSGKSVVLSKHKN